MACKPHHAVAGLVEAWFPVLDAFVAETILPAFPEELTLGPSVDRRIGRDLARHRGRRWRPPSDAHQRHWRARRWFARWSLLVPPAAWLPVTGGSLAASTGIPRADPGTLPALVATGGALGCLVTLGVLGKTLGGASPRHEPIPRDAPHRSPATVRPSPPPERAQCR